MVQVTLDLKDRLGAQRKGVAVKTSDQSGKSQMLYVSTTIPKTYEPDVKRLIWKAGEPRDEKSLSLKNASEEPFPLINATAERDGAEVKLRTVRAGFEYDLIISPSADLKNVLIPVRILPERPESLSAVKSFTVFVLLK